MSNVGTRCDQCGARRWELTCTSLTVVYEESKIVISDNYQCVECGTCYCFDSETKTDSLLMAAIKMLKSGAIPLNFE